MSISSEVWLADCFNEWIDIKFTKLIWMINSQINEYIDLNNKQFAIRE